MSKIPYFYPTTVGTTFWDIPVAGKFGTIKIAAPKVPKLQLPQK